MLVMSHAGLTKIVLLPSAMSSQWVVVVIGMELSAAYSHMEPP